MIEVASASDRPPNPSDGSVVKELDTGRHVTFTGQAWRYLDRPVIRKISFEHVSAIAHPEYYHGDSPAVRVEEVPDEHWTHTERQGDDLDRQYCGLLELIAGGGLIRNVRLFEADAPTEPEWREVSW